MENLAPLIFTAVIASVLVFVIYRLSAYGGIIGLMYGRRHEKLGEVVLRSIVGSSTIHLYRLEGDRVGTKGDVILEVRGTMGSMQTFPVRLAEADLQELRRLLDEAAYRD